VSGRNTIVLPEEGPEEGNERVPILRVQAIDRPLPKSEMADLRSYSTRALITVTSFVNEYSWGNFKGDEDAWTEKYFDAFLYLPIGARPSSSCACGRVYWSQGSRREERDAGATDGG
jgi:hypothetical protein